MSPQPQDTQAPAPLESAPGAAFADPQAPAVRRAPVERAHHGDTFADEFAWLAEKENPETISYLEAQNAYTEALITGQEKLRAEIFGEIRGRTQETDLSVPVRKGGWWYYARTVEGQQYPVHCRRGVLPGETIPPMRADGGPLDGEEVLLDGNELAGESMFFALGTYDVSPDGTQLAYSTDFEGSERFTVRVKNLGTGEIAADEIPGTFYGTAWSADGSALFYVTVDDAWRPSKVWRHVIGTPADSDVVVFDETDERFWVGVELTRSERYLVISSSSKLTSEVRLLDAADPAGEFTVVAPRRHGVEYSVEHQLDADGSGRLLILHNENAENFELAQATLADPGTWTPVIGHRADTRLLNVDAFAGHLVVHLRRDGLTGLLVVRGEREYEIDFPEPLCRVGPLANPEYDATAFRLSYVSMITPDSVYDCDVATGELTLLRRRPVLPLPGGGEYDPADYQQRRDWAIASDGTKVPISLVWRSDTPLDGTAPCLLYGYGSYEISIDPSFSVPRLSLLDRGFIYAIAHIRGGGEMGRGWYDDGKMLHKVNTFSDFVASARHLADQNWTQPKRIVARGASAGGLLMGASVNMAPAAFGGIVAQVPFVDALTTILDPSLPLTVTEWEEWGDPLHDPEVYQYMKSYTPYENIDPAAVYPPILAVTSLNDTRVLYSEPAKWIARLQASAQGGPFLLKTEMIAGHGGRSGRYDAWREEAMVLAWIIEAAAAAAQA
ncbi:MAG: S9 family peptidase [Streptosporangiaceae bacterium]